MIVMAMSNSDGSAVSHHDGSSPENTQCQFLHYFIVTFYGQYLKQPFASKKVILILSGVVLNKRWYMAVSHHNLRGSHSS